MRFCVVLGLFWCGFAISNPARADLWIGGHGDIGVALTNTNELELHFHFENAVDAAGGGTIPAGEYAPTDHSVFIAGPPILRPSGSSWDFLGAPTDSIWYLADFVEPNKPFLGWGLEDLDPADWNGQLTWNLVSVVSAPTGGNFSLWSESFGTPTVRFATSDGITVADAFTQTAGGHEHFFLGFSREGIYQVELGISGNHKTLGNLSGTGVFTYAAGVPEPSSIALLSVVSTGGCFGWIRRKRRTKCS